MYDNPSNFGGMEKELLGQIFDFSGSVWTSTSREPKPEDYIKEFRKLGLTKPCMRFIKKLKLKFPMLIKEATHSIVLEKRKQAFIKYLHNRLEDFNRAEKGEL